MSSSNIKTKLVTTLCSHEKQDSSSSSEVIVRLPVPYQLPPQPNSPEDDSDALNFGSALEIACNAPFSVFSSPFSDVPWSWDRLYTKKDVYGRTWP
ncbi:hypothetical protein KSP40_PGU009961 [Platanthera guangdongensis]|uniref:Uncharacterized protein n=1 Tax=Platanthera guangdongensis TaxID=2320717 RepID=A0ABR2M831_9ASPA